MTTMLIIFIAVVIIVAIIIYFLSKSKGKNLSEKYSAKTEDLINDYSGPGETVVKDSDARSFARKNGTAVLTPEMEESRGEINTGSNNNYNRPKNGGTAVLKTEDNPFGPSTVKGTPEKAKPVRHGTEVLKEDDPVLKKEPEQNKAEIKKEDGKAPPTELLQKELVEEKGASLFQKKGAKDAYLQQRRTKIKIKIEDDTFTIGREPDLVDLCISDNLSVSRHHATITRKGNDYYLVDHGSMNYTFVNNLKLEPEKEMKIKNHDRIMLGDEAFVFLVK